MLFTRSQLRDSLITAGAASGTWTKPSTAEILAAVALAATSSHGAADNNLGGACVTCFQIMWRPDAPAGTPRNREWLTASFSHACLAAVALTHMHGLRTWPQYTSGKYRQYLPEAFPPPIQREDGTIPYQVAPLIAGMPLRLLMKACGWIAPSAADTDRVARENDFPTAADIPAGFIMRIPVQRGW